MSKYIDADLYVEMQIYDDEHEEWSQWKGTIEDLLDQWTEEGCPTPIEVSEDCSDYYKGYCAKYEDGCFHQCKDTPSVTTEQSSRVDVVTCEDCRWQDDCSQVVANIEGTASTMLRWCSDGEREE